MMILPLSEATTTWQRTNPGRTYPLLDPGSEKSARLDAQPALRDGIQRAAGFYTPASMPVGALFTHAYTGPPSQISWTSNVTPRLSELWPQPTPADAEVRSLIDRIEPLVDHTPNPYLVTLEQRVVSGGGAGLPNFDNWGGAIGMLKAYIRGGLPPHMILSNTIGIRDYLIRTHAPQHIIARAIADVGRVAIWYKRHWEGTPEDWFAGGPSS